MPFFPNFLLRDLLLWLIVLNILAILAVFFPWELGEKADPFASAPAGIRPEWYFLFMFQTLKYLPAQDPRSSTAKCSAFSLFGVAGLLWMLVPFWDRKSSAGQQSRLITYVGIVVVAVYPRPHNSRMAPVTTYSAHLALLLILLAAAHSGTGRGPVL